MVVKVFTGFDARESAGWHVFVASLLITSKDYILMPPFTGMAGDGTNDFSYGRFRVPRLCHWAGPAIYLDGADMLLRAPIDELMSLYDSRYALQVVKHDYLTKHPRKYVGTPLEAPNESYPRKNWSSVILFNCGHPAHLKAWEALSGNDGRYLHRFSWLKDEEIGELPQEWNHLVGEQDFNPEAKLAHFTLGIPGFTHYSFCDYAGEWRDVLRQANRGMA